MLLNINFLSDNSLISAKLFVISAELLVLSVKGVSFLLCHASGFNKCRSVVVLDHQPELHEEPSCFSLLFFKSRVLWEIRPKWFVSDILAFCSGLSLLKYGKHADYTRVSPISHYF